MLLATLRSAMPARLLLICFRSWFATIFFIAAIWLGLPSRGYCASSGPSLLSAIGNKNLTNISISFVEQLSSETAFTTNFEIFVSANYSNRLTVLDAAVLNGTNVLLTTTPRTFGIDYRLRVHEAIAVSSNSPPADYPQELDMRYQVELASIISDTPWLFYQNGNLPGTNWASAVYDDFFWPIGYPLFYGARFPRQLPAPVRTTLDLLDLAGNSQVMTYYFRTEFDLPGPLLEDSLQIRHIVDDGAVVSLNNQEIYSVGMDGPRPVDYMDRATRNVGLIPPYEPPLTAPPITVPVSNAVLGENTLAVEIHQVSASNSDVAFGLVVEAILLNFSHGVRLELPRYVDENGGVYQNAGNLTLNRAWDEDLVFQLSTSDSNRLIVPTTLTIPVGSTQAMFNLSVPDNSVRDERQPVQVTAQSTSLPKISRTVLVQDDESNNLIFSTASRFDESDGTVLAGTVSIERFLAEDLAVEILSSDSNRLVGLEVVIPAGQHSSDVYFAIIENSIPDGLQELQVTAKASDMAPASVPVTIGDNDPTFFVFDTIQEPQLVGTNFPIAITAYNASGEIVPFSGTINLNATNLMGSVAISSSQAGPFVDGIWNGDATVMTVAKDVILVASYTNALTSLSNPFDVEMPPIQVNLDILDLAYDSTRRLLYGLIPHDGGALSNRIVVMNPASGLIEKTIDLSQPLSASPVGHRVMTLTDDGQYLYVATSNALFISRVNLSTDLVDLHFPVGPHPTFQGQRLIVGDMTVLPGTTDLLAVNRRAQLVPQGSIDLAIFDKGIRLPQTATPFNAPHVSLIATGLTASVLYGDEVAYGDNIPQHLVEFSVDETGVIGNGVTANVLKGTSPLNDLVSDGGFLFGTAGQILDLASPISRFGTIPARGLVAPDVANGRVYFISSITNRFVIESFDFPSLQPQRSLVLPGDGGAVTRFLRMDSNSLTFASSAGRVYLVQSSHLGSEGRKADLEINLTHLRSGPGLPIRFFVSITNKGPDIAYSASIYDTLPMNASMLSITNSKGVTTLYAGLLRWQLGSIPAGSGATLMMEMQPQENGWILNQAYVEANEFDAVPDNNSAADAAFAAQPLGDNSVRQFSFPSRDLVYDAERGLIYASAPGIVASELDRLIAVNPDIGDTVGSWYLGDYASRLSIAKGNEVLYVATETNQAIARFELTTQTPDLSFRLNNYAPASTVAAADIQVLPEHPESLVVLRITDGWSAELAVYDDGVARTNAAASNSDLYTEVLTMGIDPSLAYVQSDGNAGFQRFSIDEEGVRFLDSDNSLLPRRSLVDIEWGAGSIYSSVGIVFDPHTFTTLGNLDEITAQSIMEYDPESERMFYLTQSGSQAVIRAFDPNSLELLGSTIISNLSGVASSLVRWGANGLAFRTSADQLILLTTSLVPTNSPTDFALSLVMESGQLILSWPTNAVDYKLQSTVNLTRPTSWIDFTNCHVAIGDRFVITNEINRTSEYYRLIKP